MASFVGDVVVSRKKTLRYVIQYIMLLPRNWSVVRSKPLKGSRGNHEQETLPSFHITDW